MSDGVLNGVPGFVSAKLATLAESEVDAQAVVQATARRLSDLHRSAVIRPHGEEARDREVEVARLQKKLATAQESHQAIAALNSRLRQWIGERLATGHVLASCGSSKPKLKVVDNYAATVTRFRGEIASLQAELNTINQAAPSLDDMKAMAAEFVKRKAEQARPRIIANFDGFNVDASATSWGSARPDFIGLMSWYDGKAMLARLNAEIDRLPKSAVTLSRAERDEQRRITERRLFDFERAEEMLIEAAAEQGQVIARRLNAQPGAILGVEAFATSMAAAS